MLINYIINKQKITGECEHKSEREINKKRLKNKII